MPDAAECWRGLAGLLSVDELIVAGDGLLCRQDPPSTIEQVGSVVLANSGRRGNADLRAALDLVRGRTDSPQETRLRLVLVRAGLPEGEVNGVLTEPGEKTRFGDLVYRQEKVVVEYEGAHHQTSRASYLQDVDRFGQLARRWEFVRVTKEHDPRSVVAQVSAALRRGGWMP